MEDVEEKSLGREYLSILVRRWRWLVAIVVFSGGYEVVKYIAESAGYQLVLPRWIGYAVAGLALFVAQFFVFVDMRRQRDEARAVIATNRPRVAPELIYTPVGNVGRERVTLHVTNVGEWPLRELSIQPIGTEGHTRATFDLVQVLKGGGERCEVRVRLSGNPLPHDLPEVLAKAFGVRSIAAQRRGAKLSRHDAHIPLVLSYRDVPTGKPYTDTFCFEFAEPASQIPQDGRWVIRSHPPAIRGKTLAAAADPSDGP